MNRIREFNVLEKIGEGSFSSVYKVKKDSEETFYALKRVKILKLKDKDKENTLNEIRLLASIADKQIIAYKEVFIDDATSTLCLIMEFADGGDLLAKIKKVKENPGYMREDEIWKVFLQILKGTAALHKLEIIHRDLKCANIFLFKDGRVKIGDLNVSKIAKSGFLTTQTGTPYYTSPEIYKDKPYDGKSDIWSLGCILYEMCLLRPPFMARNFKELRRSVLLGAYPPLPPFYSDELGQIVKLLLQLNPEQRPSSVDLLKHPIIIKKIKKYIEGKPGIGKISVMADSNKASTMQVEPRSRILMKTIRMKDLESLKLNLPKPNYQPGAGMSPSHKQVGLSLDSSSGVNYLPSISPQHLQGGGNISARSRKQVDAEASSNPVSHSLDQVRIPSDRFAPIAQPARVGVISKAKFIDLDGNFKRNLDEDSVNAIRGKMNRNSEAIRGLGINGLKSNINIQDPRNGGDLPLVNHSNSVSKSPEPSRAKKLPGYASKDAVEPGGTENNQDFTIPPVNIIHPGGSEWVQAAQRIQSTKNHAAIKLRTITKEIHQKPLDSLDRESLRSPSLGLERAEADKRLSSRDGQSQNQAKEAKSHSIDVPKHLYVKLPVQGLLSDERSRSFAHEKSEYQGLKSRETEGLNNPHKRLSRQTHEHLQMIVQQSQGNHGAGKFRLEAPIKQNVSLNLHQVLKSNSKVFATQGLNNSTFDLEDGEGKQNSPQLPRFRQNVLASNLLGQKKSQDFNNGSSVLATNNKGSLGPPNCNQVDSLEQLVDEKKAVRRSIRLNSVNKSGLSSNQHMASLVDDRLLDSHRSREALEVALALDIGPPDREMKRNSSKINTTAYSHTQAVELNLD